jgi:cyclin D2
MINDYEKIQRDSGNSSNCSSSSSSSSDSSSSDSSGLGRGRVAAPSLLTNEYFFDEDDDDDGGGGKSSATKNDDKGTAATAAAKAASPASAPLVDFTLLNDPRALDNLIFLEDYYRIQANYFVYIQTDIKAWMRKTLASWMLEVCKNQSTEEDIFCVAMNLLDRFLALQPIAKRHLQLLGTVCMFIAAKLKCSSNFSAETLCIYTANSISIEELLNWEQFVLQKLKWDVNAITPFDFVPFLLNKLGLLEHKSIGRVRHHLASFISVCATEFKFSFLPASMIAAGCLYLTIKHLNGLSKLESQAILSDVHKTLNCVDFECLIQCIEQIEELATRELKITFNSHQTSTQEYSSNASACQQQPQQQLCELSTC